MRVKSLPKVETFKLQSDPEGLATVTIRQAREEENIRRQDLFSKVTRVFEESTELGPVRNRIEIEANELRIRRTECYLVIEEITGILDENGNELFRSAGGPSGKLVRNAMTIQEFDRAWSMLPEDTIEEIYAYVLTMNPTWDNEKKGK